MASSTTLVIAAAAALLGLVRSAPVRISCVGDSITAGVCSSSTHGYPAVLQGLLGPGFDVMNFGDSGKTMLRHGLCSGNGADCSYWDGPQYPKAIASNPDIVTIMLGTNDAKNFNWFNPATGNYTADYLDMISIFAALPSKPKIYLMIPPPLYPPDPYSMNATVINKDFPVLIPQIARVAGVEGVIDVFDALGGANLTQPGITCDGCHPRDAGYEEIAKVMYNTLKPALLGSA